MKKLIPLLLIGTLIVLLLALFSNIDAIENITGYVLLDLDKDAIERNSPFDRVKEDQIKVYKNLIIMHIKDSELVTLENTNSMDPLIDENSNAIQIKPKDEDDIHIGDIVSYSNSNDTILHRVVGIGEDKEGKYYMLMGDNLDSLDQIKVRFGQIKGVVVGIIY